MKQFIRLPGPGLRYAVIVCSLSFALLSCGDKVDGYLDRTDNLIRKYEDMAEAKTITYAETGRLRKELEEIDRAFRLKVGKEPDQWTDNQRQRSVQFAARLEKIRQAAAVNEVEKYR